MVFSGWSGVVVVMRFFLLPFQLSRSSGELFQSHRESVRAVNVREKSKFYLASNIAHPLPNPPPLRASPCGGGDNRFLEGQQFFFFKEGFGAVAGLWVAEAGFAEGAQ